MNLPKALAIGILATASCLALSAQAPPQWAGAPAVDLRGLWEATLRFGPDVRGPLLVLHRDDGWRGDVSGFSIDAAAKGSAISFALPDGKGSFRGERHGERIDGFWIQASTQFSGRPYATPVTLLPAGSGRWRGELTPFDDRFTFYLPVTESPDGGLRAYLRNPDRNQGRFLRVSRIALDGAEVRLYAENGTASVVTGRYQDGVITMALRGGTYDFKKAIDLTSNSFYPRGLPAPRYRYSPPVALDDGWPVAAVEDVGISRQEIERFVQMIIDMPMEGLDTHQLHGLLVARHGKLVVEEYFHGYHRDLPHDLRSASKSWTSTLIGAAMQAGIAIREDTPVYATMLGKPPADLDPRKASMTLAHLLGMTAGFNCDPDDPKSADEDVMSDAGVEDWYAYTLAAPLVSAPGEKVFYCSTEPNLAAGMLAKIAGEPLPELFDRLIGRPLQMRGYHLFLQPSGEPYGGGGHQFLPRDFLKLPQLLLNDGRWNGSRILPPGWVDRIRQALRDLSATTQYAYLWNSVEYPYGEGKVRAFFAGGNGGQIFMAIPELDLAIGFTGGNYAAPSTFTAQREYVPKYLLPAVSGPPDGRARP